MSLFTDLLSKAQQLEVELKKAGTVASSDAQTVLTDLIENLQHQVNKEVVAPPASTPEGEATPNVPTAPDTTTPPTPPAPALAPTDPAAGVQNTSDLGGLPPQAA